MRVIKIFGIFFLLSMSFLPVGAAADKTPVRLARLPIIFAHNKPNFETCATLETKLSRAFSIPMNGTLQLADYIDSQESSSALNKIWRELRAKNKKASLTEAMRPLAEKINADIILCPVLRRYSEVHVQSNRNLETKIISNVAATLIIYDRRTDELIENKDSRSFNDGSSRFGKASYLAGECFDRLIDATKIRQKINAIK